MMLHRPAIACLAAILAATAAAQTDPGPPPPPPDLNGMLPSAAANASQQYGHARASWEAAKLNYVETREHYIAPVLPEVPPLKFERTDSREEREKKWEAHQALDRERRAAEKAAQPELDRMRALAGLPPSHPPVRLTRGSLQLEPGYSWRTKAADAWLRPEDIDRLSQTSLLISGPYFKQSFDIYTRNWLPPFVTSDSVLDAFNVLVAATVRVHDNAQIDRLRTALETTWKDVASSPDAPRIALIIGPPLRLLGSAVPFGNSMTEAQVADQVARIKAGVGRALPDWLAPGDEALPAIDYTLFKPVSVHAGRPQLEQYYRAVRWLQTVPLRADRPAEASAGLTLRRAWARNSQGFGEYDDTGARLGLRPDYKAQSASRYRLLATFTFPEFNWIQRLADASPGTARHLGLAVAVWLGSELASSLLPANEKASLKSALAGLDAKAKAGLSGPIGSYYDALRSLNAPPDPAAPEFMRGDAWQRKSLQTGLAGWALIRHAAELASKRNEVTFGIEIRPAGFAEPNPAFFESIANAAERVQLEFDSDLTAKEDPLDLQRRWRGYETMCLRLALLAEKELRGEDFTSEEGNFLANFGETLAGTMGYEADAWMKPRDDAPQTVNVADDSQRGLHVAEAVGRPRALYVVYPWKGQQVLCRGAVLTYYESVTPDRLTDEEWKAKLSGDHPPQQPDWIKPLLRP